MTVKTDGKTVSADGFFSILWILVLRPLIPPPMLSIFNVTGVGETYKATSLPYQVLSKLLEREEEGILFKGEKVRFTVRGLQSGWQNEVSEAP